MTLKVKLNSFFQFIIRRKLVIIITALLTCGIFVGLENQNAKNKQAEIQQVPAAEIVYCSEFTFMVEQVEKTADIATTKETFIGDESQKVLGSKGMRLEENEIEPSLTIFTRGATGEYMHVRVVNKDKDAVTELVTALYDMVKNKEISYFKNKEIYISKKPTEASDVIPQYSDYYTSTDSSLFKQNNAKTSEPYKVNYVRFGLIGFLLGIIIGIFLSLFIDIKDKLIHSVSYIKTLFEFEVPIFDASYEDIEEIENYLDVCLAHGNDKLVIVTEKESQLLEKWQEKRKEKVLVTNAVDENAVQFGVDAILLVNKNKTKSNWLKKQYELLRMADKDSTILFVNEAKLKK